MKKLIVTLIALAILSVLMVPAMATENSAIKDYDSAADGELLYTVDFNGNDGVIELGNLWDNASTDYFSYTPSEDGSALTVKGARDSGEKGCIWGGTIDQLEADATTVYTMTFKVTVHGEVGLNNSVGVGGYFFSGDSGSSVRALNYYGNWNTSENGETYMRRGVLQLNNAKYNEAAYTMYNTLLDSYEVDEDGYITAMLIFDGPTMTYSAYLRTENAGDGSAASDWVKVTQDVYVPTKDCMGFMVYSYYIETVHATIKDVNIYKGKIYQEPVAPETEPPTEESVPSTTDGTVTTVPATGPATVPSEDIPAMNTGSDSDDSSPAVWIVIGVLILLAAGIAVFIIVKKKKDTK